MKNRDKYLIFGAEMGNKGAQAMLFVTISEIRKRDPKANIIVFIESKCTSGKKPEIYNVQFMTISMSLIMSMSHTLLSFFYKAVKKPTTKELSYEIQNLDSVFKTAKIAFDISGYALSNQWGINASLYYLSKFALLHDYGIPSYIMPQSFGPFDYHSKFKNFVVHKYIKKYLRYAEKIYAREDEGYKALTREMGLTNVEQSTDLVLQSADINLNSVYKEVPEFRKFVTESENCVAIIPNSSNLKYIDEGVLEKIYFEIITWLSSHNKHVYVLAHSNMDFESCKSILNKCGNSVDVKLIDADLNCIEYGDFVGQFDYIIASRFHSIVNAYKKGIPCIAIGWATKYKDLLNSVHQRKYCFDVRDLNSSYPIIEALENMERQYTQESAIIAEDVCRIQCDSCFSFLDYINF
ncbi:MAG: polysaccharide pyruvyl transferase family protein [Ruminococcus sp.]|nr:polysaccharide pyruvyl transferase family protein [Ruminococcus sp.]